jgi:hypothetical protein
MAVVGCLENNELVVSEEKEAEETNLLGMGMEAGHGRLDFGPASGSRTIDLRQHMTK